MAHLYVQAASTQKKRSSSRTTRMSYPMISKCFIPPSEMSSTLQRLTSVSIARGELPGGLKGFVGPCPSRSRRPRARSHPGKHRGHVLRTADEIREAEVLVRRMVVRAVVRNPWAGNRWHADDLVEEPMGGGARRPRPDLRLPPVRIDGALDRGFHDPRAQRDGSGLEGLLRRGELDVAKALRGHVFSQFHELLLLSHIRDEPKVDLRFRDRGVHGLRALLDVPAHEAANRASRGIDQASEQLEIAPAADEFGDAPELFEGLRLEGARVQVPQLAGTRAPRVRVPAGDLDSTLRVA